MKLPKQIALFLACVALAACTGCVSSDAVAGTPAVNVILFIGDGMGPEQVRAGVAFKGAPLSFQSWQHQGNVTTLSANAAVTDSAAGATAMATGHKVNNGVVSVATPGDGEPLETALEYFQKKGKRVGLVTTTHMTHATPACFGAHEPSRSNYAQIAGDYFSSSRPDVLLGGGGAGMTVPGAVAAGYTVVANRAEMLQATTAGTSMLCGQFGSGHMPYEHDGLGDLPHLHEMTRCTLTLLEDAPEGFFLMVEGGRIDHAGHANDIARSVRETVAFDEAVQVAVDWAKGRRDTLMIVTADHETGGLAVLEDKGAGVEPAVSWSTTGHTGTNVGVYAQGPGAEAVSGTIDNTDIYRTVVSGWQP